LLKENSRERLPMRSLSRPAAVLSLLALGFLLGVGLPELAQGQAEDRKKEGWVDYDDLSQADRLKERPGNYLVLRAIADSLTGQYKVRPDLSMCAFPFQEDSKTFESLEDADKALDEAARGRTRKNKLRQFNVNVKSLTVYDPEEMVESPELRKKAKFGDSRLKRLQEVRKRHPCRAVLVLADLLLQSLQSPKIEGGEGEEIVFYLVHAKGQWKVAWFDK
jgi:hypothetical protein